jgi:hypothetical protein
MPQCGRSGPRTGVSVLTSDASFARGKGRVRQDQHMTASGPAPGPVPIHGGPTGGSIAPNIGPNEPRGPADIARGDRKRQW